MDTLNFKTPGIVDRDTDISDGFFSIDVSAIWGNGNVTIDREFDAIWGNGNVTITVGDSADTLDLLL